MKQKLLSFIFVLTCLIGVSFAQNRQVSGKVTSATDGSPISGVSVAVVGTSVATQTDVSGNYTIQVSSDALLNVSYVGYIPQRIQLTGRTIVNVQLVSDETSLDEVVVTALGVRREKRALGYSTQEVKSDALNSGSNPSLVGAIQGKVAGVEVTPSSGMPGASAKLTIRGSRSFTGNNTPLYVVDGLPINSTAEISTLNSVTGADFATRALDIDPNDIESVNVLKGQAASALYGMRASNGVIIITTKSGKNARGKAQVSFNSAASFDVVSRLPDFQTEYAQGQINLTTGRSEYAPLSSLSWGPRVADLANDPVYGGNTNNQYSNGDSKYRGMYYVPQRAAAGLDPWAVPQVYNNVKDFFDVGATYSNNVNVIQGFDKGSYAVSLGSTNQQGIVPSTGLDRYNAKLAGEAKLSDYFNMGFTGNFVSSVLTKQSTANNGIVATLYPAPPSYDLAGIPSHIAGNPYAQNTYRTTAGFDGVYWAVENNSFTERTNRFFGNTYLNYSSKLGTQNQKFDIKYQLGTDSYTTNYSDVWGYGHANLTGEIEESRVTVNELNSLLTAAYNWEISEDLIFDALAGNEIIDRTRKYDYAYGGNFNFSGFNHMNNASTYSASEEFRKSRTFGTFLNLSLAYKNMLFLSATGRNDIISTMPRGNRSFFYPSVSLSWVFTELEGLKSNSVLSYGKIRTSFAQVGQAGTYLPSYYATPEYTGGFSQGTPIIYPIGSIVSYTPYGVVYDPNLRPQNTNSYEIGTDLTFFNGLVDLSYTFSRQDVKDQIFQVPLAASTGYSSLVTNGGKVHTNAHEVVLNFNPIKRPELNWNFGFNFAKIDNYVDELKEGVESIFLGGFVDPQVRASVGEKFPTIYGVGFMRNEAGQIIVDERGLPMAGTEQVLGRVAPDFILGFNTALTYKKIRLAAVLDWKQGGKMYAGTTGLLDFYGVTQKSADYRQEGYEFMFDQPAVKVVGQDANGDNIYAENDIKLTGEDAYDYFNRLNNISEGSVRGSSFVKVREISLGYPVFTKGNLNLNLNVFARNLILWSEIEGLDPESSQGNTNMSGAFERFSLPGTSSYGLGLNLKF